MADENGWDWGENGPVAVRGWPDLRGSQPAPRESWPDLRGSPAGTEEEQLRRRERYAREAYGLGDAVYENAQQPSSQVPHVMDTIQGGRREYLPFPVGGGSPAARLTGQQGAQAFQQAEQARQLETQLWNNRPFSRSELSQLQGLERGLTSVASDLAGGILTPQDAARVTADIRQDMIPLLARQQHAQQFSQQQMLQQQQQLVMHQAALQEHIRGTNGQVRAQALESNIAVVTNPLTGEVQHMMPTHNGGWEPVPWQQQVVPGQQPWMNSPEGVEAEVRRVADQNWAIAGRPPLTPAQRLAVTNHARTEVMGQVRHVQGLQSRQGTEQLAQHRQQEAEATRRRAFYEGVVRHETDQVRQERLAWEREAHRAQAANPPHPIPDRPSWLGDGRAGPRTDEMAAAEEVQRRVRQHLLHHGMAPEQFQRPQRAQPGAPQRAQQGAQPAGNAAFDALMQRFMAPPAQPSTTPPPAPDPNRMIGPESGMPSPEEGHTPFGGL